MRICISRIYQKPKVNDNIAKTHVPQNYSDMSDDDLLVARLTLYVIGHIASVVA